MKNSEDEDDLFGAKRPRGRPRTGAAKSGAERQRSYRKQSRARDRVSLSVMISVEARVSLDALARHHGCSLAEVLEPLLIAEKDKIVAQIYATGTPEEQEAASARFFMYFICNTLFGLPGQAQIYATGTPEEQEAASVRFFELNNISSQVTNI